MNSVTYCLKVLDNNDVAPAQLREVVCHAAPDDAGAYDNHTGMLLHLASRPYWTDVSHIDLPEPRHYTILDESQGSITQECSQPVHQAKSESWA